MIASMGFLKLLKASIILGFHSILLLFSIRTGKSQGLSGFSRRISFKSTVDVCVSILSSAFLQKYGQGTANSLPIKLLVATSHNYVCAPHSPLPPFGLVKNNLPHSLSCQQTVFFFFLSTIIISQNYPNVKN
jgi:hypothetical protein